MVIQPDGKIVIGGQEPGVAYPNTILALARYNRDGTLDTTFGNQGIVTTTVGLPGFDNINALALQADGKIVAVGDARSYVGSSRHKTSASVFLVARYNANGTLDTSFGGGTSPSGVALTSTSTYGSGATAVGIQVDGKIDVGGWSELPNNQGILANDFTLVRYNANGTLDTTFAPNKSGIAITPPFGGTSDAADIVTSMAIQADGKVLLAGNTGPGAVAMALVRYTSTGLLDTSFNGSGIVQGVSPPGFNFKTANGVLVETSGSIVVSGNSWIGNSTEELTLVGFTSAGQLDATFGNSGFAVNSNMLAGYTITQGPNGDLLVGGTVGAISNGTYALAAAAYLPGGSPDASFGTGGIASVPLSGNPERGRALAIEPDGKIVVAGFDASPSGSNYDRTVLARFLPPDTKIGSFTGSSAAGSVTLTASNILNSNPTGTINSVNFYLQNPDLSLTLLGSGTNNNGTWTFTFAEATYGLTSGNSYTFVAQAVDSNGVLSDPLAISLQVM